MDYKIGDLLAHYSATTKQLLDICVVSDKQLVYSEWAYRYTSYSNEVPDIHYTLHFRNSTNMNGIYDGRAFNSLTLMTLKDYGEKYGQQIKNGQ